MDRMIYTVLNSMQNSQTLRSVSAQNLANQNVPGYRKDLVTDSSSAKLGFAEGFEARAFQTSRAGADFSQEVGFMNQTGDPFDISISDKGYFFVQEGNSEIGLSRRGDLRTDKDGLLLNGAGEKILNQAMQPITLPPYKRFTINEVGEILITPLDAPDGFQEVVATIATVVTDQPLEKGYDALIRPINGPMPRPNQLASVQQGVLEGSNVNITEELIANIDLQRNFELNMKMVSTAQELDEAGTRIMRPAQG
ncbi:flagellar hook-basal body complex protein [Marivivens sp. LCG002]|uniref:flagellar hook-basal body complex protein n=1 Tax=Marivivens sp. LCG002 TaxID=3051171 RepID=UPI0025549D43|nr:flagellar hook-basal body complex protein [Marivivens sp. LCG002]WIV51264.1 flagellar hook-basal body complex protein [Marivivens sp. LCG002]